MDSGRYVCVQSLLFEIENFNSPKRIFLGKGDSIAGRVEIIVA